MRIINHDNIYHLICYTLKKCWIVNVTEITEVILYYWFWQVILLMLLANHDFNNNTRSHVCLTWSVVVSKKVIIWLMIWSLTGGSNNWLVNKKKFQMMTIFFNCLLSKHKNTKLWLSFSYFWAALFHFRSCYGPSPVSYNSFFRSPKESKMNL